MTKALKYRRLISDRSGTTLVESIVIVASVALAALAAWQMLGDTIVTDVDCASDAIGGSYAGGPCAGATAASTTRASESASASASASRGALTRGAGEPSSATSAPTSSGTGDSLGQASTDAASRTRSALTESQPSRGGLDGASVQARVSTATSGDTSALAAPSDRAGAETALTSPATAHVSDVSGDTAPAADSGTGDSAEGGGGLPGWLDDHIGSPLVSAAGTGWSFTKGLGLGIYDGGEKLVVGTAKLVWNLNRWMLSSGFHPFDFRPDRPLRAGRTLGRFGETLWHAVTRPADTASSIARVGSAIFGTIWSGLKHAGTTLLHGNAEQRGHLVGETSFNVATLFVPFTKAGTIDKLGALTGAARARWLGRAAGAARIGGTADGIVRLGLAADDVAVGADLLTSARVSSTMARDVAPDALRTATVRDGVFGGEEFGNLHLADLERGPDALARLAADATGQSYDDVVARWTSVRHAFGQSNNPIQFSWELEGTSRSILRFYRPEEVSEAEWAAMSIAERTASAGPGDYSNLVRMNSAPKWMRQDLKQEVSDAVWETTSHRYARTVGDLFDQGTLVNDELGGGFHWHVSFRYANAQRHANEIADYLANANEYTTLRMFGSHPSNVHHKYLGPYSNDAIEQLREGLVSGSPVDDKFSTFSMRTDIYGHHYNSSRIGFEIRAINYDLADASRAIDNTVRFLEDPTSSAIRLGDGEGRAYHVAETAGVDRLSSSTIERFSEDTQGFLREAADSADEGLWDHDELLMRWTTPMVRWEDRAFLAPYSHEIEAARERFVQGVEAVRASGAATAATQARIEQLVYQWARETRLWTHY